MKAILKTGRAIDVRGWELVRMRKELDGRETKSDFTLGVIRCARKAGEFPVVTHDPKVIAHLLRSIANGATAQAQGHDMIFKAAADLLERVPAQCALWRPIETAPKNGTRVYLGDAKNVVTGYWSPPVGAWRCDWLVGNAHDKPTHWRPLPAPPSAVTSTERKTDGS